MRAITASLILLTGAEGAAAHALDTSHSFSEQLAHQFGAPHHVLLLLGFVALLVAGHRVFRMRRQRND